MRLLPWRRDGWTVDHLHQLPRGDGCTYELVDGALWVEPPPPPEHARIVERLAAVLTEASAGTDLHVAAWRPSPPPDLVDLEPLADDEVTWVGVDDPDRDGLSLDHLRSVPTEVRLELVDGSIHLLPEPSHEHQAVVRALAARLSAAAPVLVQTDIVLDARLRLRPDVVVTGAAAVPRLVLEVTEQSTSLVDRVLRPALWADAGLMHYWRLNLEPLELVTHQLEEGGYRESGRFTDDVAVGEPVSLHERLTDLFR